MRAKLVVSGIEPGIYNETKQNETITMRAVCKEDGYGPEGLDENNTFSKWSPTADLRINITNPRLWDQFHVGQQFYVDFTEVPTTPPAEAGPAWTSEHLPISLDCSSRRSMLDDLKCFVEIYRERPTAMHLNEEGAKQVLAWAAQEDLEATGSPTDSVDRLQQLLATVLEYPVGDPQKLILGIPVIYPSDRNALE